MSFNKNILVAVCALLLSAGAVHAAPQAELWPHWQANTPESTIHIDHAAWGTFLHKYLVVSKDGTPNLVRYGSVTAADHQALADYLTRLSTVTVSQLKRTEQKAYWINLYNALTVETILNNYPVSSIREIKSGWFSPGPWDLKLIKIERLDLSLNDIEHRILRPIWRDNRIHYAVNCASYSCPNLQSEPFTAENTERLLNQAASAYVNSSRGVKFEGDTLVLSSIYDWYQVDFGGNETRLLNYLEGLADPELAGRLKAFKGSVAYSYDWHLNGL
ncbi:DUF547 domain-containing protein [Geopsychrobacter electrodiphilus]|uniref:DUF547 domain-containing protein n=1 Tax=Geopsychrobacter electrodiphilus TaxID=225196 RepID=UPI0003796051|nr:DUF547 domain-containing protein [Geopsychrobacter electrodiphilus]